MVEQSAVNRLVAGSSPASGATLIQFYGILYIIVAFVKRSWMQTIQLKVKDEITQTLIDFLNLLPKNSIKIEYPELSEDEIRAKLKKAIKDKQDGKTYSIEEAKAKLKARVG